MSFMTLLPFYTFLVGMMIGAPIAISLGGGALVFFLSAGGLPLEAFVQKMQAPFGSFSLLAIPLFVFAATVLNYAGVTRRLFEFAEALVGATTGGMAKVNVVLATLTGGVSASATADAARYIGGFEMGMTLSLERLSEHLAQKTEPFVIERTFNAPAALVWKAISNRDDMKEWYFDLAEFKPEEGFEFEFTVEHEGMKYCHRCKVTDVIPQKRLAYTWRYEGHPGDSLVTFELHAEGGQTRLRLTHTGLETFPPLPSLARTNFAKGWTQLIGTSLKEFVEKT